MINFVEKKTKCKIDIFSQKSFHNKSCNQKNFKKYFDLLILLKHGTTSRLIKRTGCRPKCNIINYSIETKRRNEALDNNWTSQVFIQPKSSIQQYQEEYLTYDTNDLISSIGGYLGLFLGWSLLTLFEAVRIVFRLCKIEKPSKT